MAFPCVGFTELVSSAYFFIQRRNPATISFDNMEKVTPEPTFSQRVAIRHKKTLRCSIQSLEMTKKSEN